MNLRFLTHSIYSFYHYSANRKCHLFITLCCIYSNALILSWKQTLWTLIRLLPVEQSNPGPYCLQYRPLKYISRRESRQQWQLMSWIAGKRAKIDNSPLHIKTNIISCLWKWIFFITLFVLQYLGQWWIWASSWDVWTYHTCETRLCSLVKTFHVHTHKAGN